MEAHTTMESRLIGAVLIEKGLITGEQLERALDLQVKTGERLGEIVVAEFGVARLELASVLAEQWAELESSQREATTVSVPALQAVEPLTPDEVQIRRPIGEIFVELGFISSDQLNAALDAQGESGARIGEILVEQGSLTRLDLASALAEQWSALQKLRPPSPVADPQPWQNGTSAAVEAVWSAADRATVSALEERLRLVEHAAATAPSQEDLSRAQFDLRAALGTVEARIEATVGSTEDEGLAATLGVLAARLDALEGASLSTELVMLRQEIEELKAQPATADLLAGLSAAVERLEQRPDTATEVEGLAAQIVVLTARLDELAGIGELRNTLDIAAKQAEIAQSGIQGLSSRLDALSGLETRLDDIAARLPGEGVVDDLRRELAALAVQTGDDADQGQSTEIASLSARLDQLAARVEDVVAAPTPDLAPRIDELSARVDEMAAAVPAPMTDGLGARIESLEEKGREGSGALERLANALEALGSHTQARLDDLVVRDDDLAEQRDSVGSLKARVGELESRIAEATPAAELREEMRRVAESTAVERASLAEALSARVAEITTTVPRRDELWELRSRLDEVAARPTEDTELRERVEDLAARLEAIGGVEASIVEMRESLKGLDALRVADALATGARIAGVETTVESLAGLELNLHDGIERAVTDRTGPLAVRLDGAESRLDVMAALEERVATLAGELERRPDSDALAGVAAELRAELEALADRPLTDDSSDRISELSEQIDRIASDDRDRIGGLVEELNGRIGSLAEVLGKRVDDLAGRVGDLVGRDELEAAAAKHGEWVRAELAASRKAGDEHAALRAQLEDLQEASAGRSAWEARLESLLEQRLDVLSGRITDEVAGARSDAEQAIHHLHGLRAEDLAATELAGAELTARLDDFAARSAAAAFEVEQALREELGGIAARLEEHDAEGIAAQDELRAELRGELERVAASVGWRLERIEESLAADDSAELRATVAELEHRLEGQLAMGEEQVRATERALRKGLASLGERLVDSESAYVDAGNALRRSIARLGAAVVEVDARMADRIPVTEEEGCVAFAPTTAGYRLVELPGKPPEIGSTVEVEGCDGQLVVTRYGNSPLPLDCRPCAYLDHA